MKRILPVAVALTLAGVCCIVAGYFCHFYYTLYRQASSELELNLDSRITDLSRVVDRLAKQRHFRPIRAEALISTTDRPEDDWSGKATNSAGKFQLGQSKPIPWVIHPEMRLTAGSAALEEFKISLWSPTTRAMDAWISPPGEPDARAAFETFEVKPDEGTNTLTLRVRARAGASVSHKFTVVILMDSAE